MRLMCITALAVLLASPSTKALDSAAAKHFKTAGSCYALYLEACETLCWDDQGNAVPDGARKAQQELKKGEKILELTYGLARELTGLSGFHAGTYFSTENAEQKMLLGWQVKDYGKGVAEEYRQSRINSLGCDSL